MTGLYVPYSLDSGAERRCFSGSVIICSYLRLIDFVYHSTLGLGAIKQREKWSYTVPCTRTGTSANKGTTRSLEGEEIGASETASLPPIRHSPFVWRGGAFERPVAQGECIGQAFHCVEDWAGGERSREGDRGRGERETTGYEPLATVKHLWPADVKAALDT